MCWSMKEHGCALFGACIVFPMQENTQALVNGLFSQEHSVRLNSVRSAIRTDLVHLNAALCVCVCIYGYAHTIIIFIYTFRKIKNAIIGNRMKKSSFMLLGVIPRYMGYIMGYIMCTTSIHV